MTASGQKAGEARTLDALTVVTHELRTPVAVLEGYLSMLDDQMPDSERERCVATMRDVAGQMRETVELLATATRIGSGTVPHSPRAFDVMEAVNAARRRVQPRVELDSARVGVLAPSARLWVWADPGHVARIVANLLNNALSYSERPAMVTVTVRPGDPIRVAVRDLGFGIPLDRQRDVFEPFQRLDAAPEQPRGLGLGLFICRELAALNGGSLALEQSAVGSGSTFCLRLPLMKDTRA